ncbi:Epsin-3, clathrin recruitment and traffic between the Golgi and endosome [Lobulomyces angularis]|nr:Epsin-3, clathrin recruitment and traffic between the Golgi and endosome [Lobulomyces angularis]
MNNFASYFDPDSITSMVNKAKNLAYGYTEYQAKVMDATNGDHWGASSSLMLDIAHATSNPQLFMEIMDTLYKKFQEKGANWRQCYKALQLLEYLIKNGSERVVDNAKDHIYELRALKNFNYTDDKHKDQGLNVRNRAKEITELLADNDKIREERKKAKENRAKYTGTASNPMSTSGMSFGGSSNGFGANRYGGFGSDSMRSGSGGFSDNYSSSKYDEDNRGSTRYDSPPRSPAKKEYDPPIEKKKIEIILKDSPKKAEPQNLLDIGGGGEDEWGDFTGSTSAQATNKPASKPSPLDDFADFQTSVLSISTATTSNVTNFSHQINMNQPNTGVNFANFQQAQPMANNQGQKSQNFGFTNFEQSTQNSFANFQASPAQTNQTGFANFNAAPVNPQGKSPIGFSSLPSQNLPPQSQQQQKQFVKSTMDPFSALVSLDAASLTGAAKKEATAGATLNSISQQQHQQSNWITSSTPAARPSFGNKTMSTGGQNSNVQNTNNGFFDNNQTLI